MNHRYDVVIAGAGPAGLACAHALAHQSPHLSVLVLEAGRAFNRRPCPVDRGRHCTGCGGVCNVISGFGGSMHYGDGVKLSLLPSGRRLVPHFRDHADALCDRAYRWLTASLDAPPSLAGLGLSPGAVAAFHEQALSIREYPVAVLSESALARVIESCFTRLSADCWYGSELCDLDPQTDGSVTVQVRTREGVQEVSAGQVVLATGRRGVSATGELLRRIGVELTPPDLSVGVRFEMDARLLAAIGEEHPDLKISQHDKTVNKVKTFCFCGGPNGGRLKFTHYHDAFGPSIITLDGHETTERVSSGRPLAANFGLLCQVQDRGDAAAAQTSFVDTYRRLSQGRPFAQRLRYFLAGQPDPVSWPDLAAALPFQPSVLDLTSGPVHELFTPAEHMSLIRGLERVMGSILNHTAGPATLIDLLDDVLVVAPELEFVWERPEIDAGCRVPGLPVYVVGDAAGIAQGVVQAAMMGLAAGDAIAERQHLTPAVTR